MKTSVYLSLATMSLATFALASVATAADYDMILVEPPGINARYSVPSDINEFGDVVGYCLVKDELNNYTYQGFYYSRERGEHWVLEPHFVLRSINNAGEMVGDDVTEFVVFQPDDGLLGKQAYYWSGPGATPEPLPPLPGGELTSASGINDMGLIVGWSADETDLDELPAIVTPVVWQVTSAGISDPMPLPRIPGDFYALAARISAPNSNGVCTIVGQSGWVLNSTVETAVRWRVKQKSNGALILTEGPVVLGTWGPTGSRGYGANSACLSVGRLYYQAFKMTKNGAPNALKRLKVEGVLAAAGIARDINESNDIVGHQLHQRGPVSNKNCGIRAVLWVGGRKLVDLNTKVDIGSKERLEDAYAINDAGIIAATLIYRRDTPCHAVLLVPRN